MKIKLKILNINILLIMDNQILNEGYEDYEDIEFSSNILNMTFNMSIWVLWIIMELN